VLEIQDICRVCVEMSESREYVESRLAACGNGVGGYEILDAGGTLLKASERFLEI